MAEGGTLDDPSYGDVLNPVWGSDVSDVVETITDTGTAGQFLQKIVSGPGKSTFGYGPPPTSVTADYQPPYVSTFGANGVTTTFTIAHGLGTETPHVEWWEPTGSGQFRRLTGIVPISNPGGNSFTVDFDAVAPASGTKVNVSTGGGSDGADASGGVTRLFPHVIDTDAGKADLVNAAYVDTAIGQGDLIQTGGYYEGTDLGGGLYRVVASGTGTDDGGSYIDFTGFQLELVVSVAVRLSQFGCRTSATDNEVQANKALTFAAARKLTVVCEELYPTEAPVLMPSYTKLFGLDRHATGFQSDDDYNILTSARYATNTGLDKYLVADVEVGIEVADLLLRGPTPASALYPQAAGSGVGLGIYGRRCRAERLDIKYTYGDGLAFEVGKTGGSEYDIDHHHFVEDIFVRRCGGKGVHWQCLDSWLGGLFVSYVRGIGVHIHSGTNTNGSSDGGFWHVYSSGYGGTTGVGTGLGGAGVVFDGRMQVNGLQLDGNFAKQLEVNTGDCMIGYIYAFLGHRWKGEAATIAATDWHITLISDTMIGSLRFKGQYGGSGVQATGNNCRVSQLHVDGRTYTDPTPGSFDGTLINGATGIGVDWDSDYGDVDHARIFGYAGTGGVGVRIGNGGALVQSALDATVTSCETNWSGSLGGVSNRYNVTTDDGPRLGNSRSFLVAETAGTVAAPSQPFYWGAGGLTTIGTVMDGILIPTYCRIESISILYGTVSGTTTATWDFRINDVNTGNTWVSAVGSDRVTYTPTTPIVLTPGQKLDIRCESRTSTLTDARATVTVLA